VVGTGTGTIIDKVKPPKFGGSTSWTVFHPSSKAAADHSNWTSCQISHLFAILQEQSAFVPRSVPTGWTHEDIVRALKDRYADHQCVEAYRTELKARIQESGKSLQDYSAAVELLVTGPCIIIRGLHTEIYSPCIRRQIDKGN
jgi:hypothetical protein